MMGGFPIPCWYVKDGYKSRVKALMLGVPSDRTLIVLENTGGMMDKLKLKPCPFCGGDAEIQEGKYQGLRTFYVSCLGCGARTDLEYAEEFAADLWNERVSYVD